MSPEDSVSVTVLHVLITSPARRYNFHHSRPVSLHNVLVAFKKFFLPGRDDLPQMHELSLSKLAGSRQMNILGLYGTRVPRDDKSQRNIFKHLSPFQRLFNGSVPRWLCSVLLKFVWQPITNSIFQLSRRQNLTRTHTPTHPHTHARTHANRIKDLLALDDRRIVRHFLTSTLVCDLS